MAKGILHTIESEMNSFSKGQKRIAHYILENYDKAAFMTASKLGVVAEVSESTVVRFAMELGYDGYPDMQKALREMVRSRMTSTQRMQEAGNRYAVNQDVLGSVLQIETERLRETAENADRASFNAVIEKLVNAKHIYILGARTSSFVAGYLNFYLHLLFENVTLVQSGAAGEIFEKLLRIGKGDVLIAISFPRYSAVTINTVRFAKDRGADVVAITDSDKSPTARLADAALLAPSAMISFVDSMVTPLSMINALLVGLGNRMGTVATDTFSDLEDIWNRYGVFDGADDE